MFTFSLFRRRVKAPGRGGSNDHGHSTIGENLAIIGYVTSQGEVHVNGRVHGDIHCLSLVFAEGSHIEGTVIAEDVIVRGRVHGSVRAFRVTLESGCHVEGDIIHQNLAIEQGAYFGGTSHQSENPMTHPLLDPEKGPQLEGSVPPNRAKPKARQKKESPNDGALDSKAETDETFSLSRRLAFEAKVRK